MPRVETVGFALTAVVVAAVMATALLAGAPAAVAAVAVVRAPKMERTATQVSAGRSLKAGALRPPRSRGTFAVGAGPGSTSALSRPNRALLPRCSSQGSILSSNIRKWRVNLHYWAFILEPVTVGNVVQVDDLSVMALRWRADAPR